MSDWAKALQNASREKKIIFAVTGAAAVLGAAAYSLKESKKTQKNVTVNPAHVAPQSKKKAKASVDREFFRQFVHFFPIIVPGVFTREAFTMAVIAIILTFRTRLDFWMISNNANIMGAVVERDRSKFFKFLIQFGLMQIPTSMVNNALHYFISMLALYFRERLTTHMHESYMEGFTFYSVSNMDNRIENADQMLTQDIENFSSSLSTLYSNITKPLVDVVVFYYKIVSKFGLKGPTMMLGYFAVAAAIMTKLREPFAWFTSSQAQLEGEFRYCHSRLITHGEEIAFYGGSKKEKEIINDTFNRLVSLVRKYLHFRTMLGVLDSCVTKYSATMLGHFIVTAPIFDPKRAARYVPSLGGDPRIIMKDYTRYIRLLMALTKAVGRLVASGRELSHLAGYISRVALLEKVLQDIRSGTFVRTQVVNKEIFETEEGEKEPTPHIDPVTSRGTIIEVEEPLIKFENVPIVTPNGDVLVRSLNFEIKAGMNCLVAGPNGCGKSSLFRVLGDLWPLCGGKMTRPSGKNLFYIPQRPYLVIGTLRDQLIYPHTKADMEKRGMSDEDLMKLVDKVALGYVVKREGGWDSVSDWSDVLSGGEKQRIAMARLFYHKPQFAVLDECTSAVSVDVEANMYSYCKEIGCTLFTISHRKTLWQFHEYVLKFDGRGGYEFIQLTGGNYESL